MVCGVRIRRACRAVYQEAYRAENRPSLMRAIVERGEHQLRLACGHVVAFKAAAPYPGQRKTKCEVCAQLPYTKPRGKTPKSAR